ncbi:MAG TPA: U-box domain-containing protein [Gammaproteobacteria bacterium]|nr:U-box domain-containing protein [Gammaproteobacteria bacterium]
MLRRPSREDKSKKSYSPLKLASLQQLTRPRPRPSLQTRKSTAFILDELSLPRSFELSPIERPQPAFRPVLYKEKFNQFTTLILFHTFLVNYYSQFVVATETLAQLAVTLAAAQLAEALVASRRLEKGVTEALLHPSHELSPFRQNFSLKVQPPLPQPPKPQQIFAPSYYNRKKPLSPSQAPTNDQRLHAVKFPDDLIPEAFKCELLSTVMDNPVRLPTTNQICDGKAVLAALTHKPENPFNRQAMKIEDAKPELELRNKIALYVDQVVERVHDKQKDLGSTKLSRADYEVIHQAVMNKLEVQATPASRR